MQDYKAPQRDTLFVMQELLGFEQHYADLGFEDASIDMVQAIFGESAKFAENVLAPLDAVGDQGCVWDEGTVTTPPGFKEAYQQYVEGGWTGMVHEPELGGQGLPYSLSGMMAEWASSANHAWAMYPGLSQGCIETVKEYASDEIKGKFLPKLIEGTWTGTMCLTEPHCGSDLGMLKCKAELNDDGSYRLNGTKIFISAGEHDLSDNIVHIVIARLPGAPEGTKGISLFAVPKFNVGEQGEVTERNGVSCGSIEHKMGINGSATCVINFDNAKGFLLGEENRGLNAMFTFMNVARIGVGVEGVAASEAAYQGALRYAKDRLQFRAMDGVKNPNGPADPIINHPDVRRMLLTQKAFAEGGRALALYCMKLADSTLYAKGEAQQTADAKLALLTPILKAFLTETALESTSYGIQIYGGHGYIKEWGMEQLARDTRISTLYEGTTGIQALDLLGRKVLGSKGKLLQLVGADLQKVCADAKSNPNLAGYAAQLEKHLGELQQMTMAIGDKAATNPLEVGAASVDYLMYSGYVVVGHFWLQIAQVAQQKLDEGTDEVDFYQAKLHTARFYFERLLPRTRGHKLGILAGADNLMAMPVEQF
ncbi:acyl-CoA dehydrogenase C-terminal domain-containing protein [Ferrimonas lipolytica]|uniref:3-methylmercaptopropionyl-CoA dehydrogenase n=1 Tax=Ferrimonas lipolytica TaxID=2724191 RepID=A0A6H1UFJ6_9GAMM|nr:acyl-CoA dehydrogenase C-terminal domain-containing protein [Ferrimonas lipolytica]QIZ77399.1 acyl-CoA dehydrogenase [Ferrimonas lipolytica]